MDKKISIFYTLNENQNDSIVSEIYVDLSTFVV